MSDDLRTRIAAALESADRIGYGTRPYTELADAVIAALQLTKQTGCPVPGHHTCTCSHRHTTPWENND